MIIIDANAIAKLALQEDGSKETRFFIKKALSAGETIGAPDIALAEALNSVWKHNVLIRDLNDKGFDIAIEEITEFWPNIEAIPTELLAHNATTISKTHRLTVYDSLYVAASLVNKAPLLTFDRPITKKHLEVGIELVKL
ncbi:MAG: type II toxin-antitoxin system VapC family toxin [Candidatus Micrarchaeota archaeon]|nr:type II toxin-antitoxin system VapC family toxin [Candidatus Micrarchaeota archaeon]